MSHFLQLLLLLTLAIAAAKLAGALAARVGQPAVFGEILVGLLLGPTVLNVLGWQVFTATAASGTTHASLGSIIRDLSEIGVLLLMFVAGLETDLGEMPLTLPTCSLSVRLKCSLISGLRLPAWPQKGGEQF